MWKTKRDLVIHTLSNIFLILAYGGIKIFRYDLVDNEITDARFPIKAHAPVSRTIELVEFDHDPGSEEVPAEFARRGLERPTYEDAFTFGIEHPEEQRRRPVAFLDEPVLVGGGRRVLVLSGSDRARRIDRRYWFAGGWNRSCGFAAVRKAARNAAA